MTPLVYILYVLTSITIILYNIFFLLTLTTRYACFSQSLRILFVPITYAHRTTIIIIIMPNFQPVGAPITLKGGITMCACYAKEFNTNAELGKHF